MTQIMNKPDLPANHSVNPSADPFDSEVNQAFLQEGIAELDAGKGIRICIDELKRRIADLDAGKGVEHDLIEVE